MDSFTERMMERANKRRERLKSQKTNFLMHPGSPVKVSALKESNSINLPTVPSSFSKINCIPSIIKAEESLSPKEIIPVNSKPLAESVKLALLGNQVEKMNGSCKTKNSLREESGLPVNDLNKKEVVWEINSSCQKENRYQSKTAALSDSFPDKKTSNIGSVLQKASLYESRENPVKPIARKDPAELSVAERKALFEKNKGSAILPKVPFAHPLPASKAESSSTKISAVSQKYTLEGVTPSQISECSRAISTIKTQNLNLEVRKNKSELSTDNELSRERCHQNSEKTLFYYEGKNEHNALKKNKTFEDRKRPNEKDDESITGSESEVHYNTLSDSVSSNPICGPSPCKQSRSESFKNRCDVGTVYSGLQEINKSQTSQEFDCAQSGDINSDQPLTHTVSLYRKFQSENENSTVPVKKVIHQSTSSDDIKNLGIEEKTEKEAVINKIAELERKVSAETIIISQATQALNLCCSTVEFTDSPEQIEAERLLLLASHRKQAALNEIQRLRVEGTLKLRRANSNIWTDQGSLTVSEITLPIKLDVIRLATREEKCHHFVCLLKYDEVVLGTSVVAASGKNLQPTSNETVLLQFPNVIMFPKLYSDFKIKVEIYHIVACSKDDLPHDVKYHISSKKDCSKRRITPKKHKPNVKLPQPVVTSPTGSSSPKTNKFLLVGFIVFSLREVERTQFTLNKVMHPNPLGGKIQLKLSCELAPSVEHQGFLTMFEDVSGFGAWHRRWCLLKGDSLSYWKYPNDERIKAPMDTIDLNTCTAQSVGAVSRDICARPNTFLLETLRPTRDEDVDSLVLVRHATHTMVRYLLSTDTKEERVEWCSAINKALALIHTWRKK